ncbi:uncharacterized protein VP01_742g4, partial [Puccinia sorghi]
VFNVEGVVFDKFLDDFRFALQSLHQTGTVLAYTQEFNSHARTVGWANNPLMSLYQHRLKENLQLSVAMSNINRPDN